MMFTKTTTMMMIIIIIALIINNNNTFFTIIITQRDVCWIALHFLAYVKHIEEKPVISTSYDDTN